MQKFLNNLLNGDINKYVAQLPQLKESISKIVVGAEQPKERPSYAYPYDSNIDIALGNSLAKKASGNMAKRYCPSKEAIIKQASAINDKNFPRTWNNFQHCCNTLDVTNAPKTYVAHNIKGINALSVTFDNDTVIILSLQSTILDDAEQRFLIGHELGHVQMGHIAAHSLQGLLQDINMRNELAGAFLCDTIVPMLNEWYRASELTADRAGYLCSKDMEAIAKLLETIDPCLADDNFTQYVELYCDHPTTATRIAELKKFVAEKGL